MNKDKTEMLNGLNFWTGVECLSPNEAPKPGDDPTFGSITWDITSDEELPWIDPIKLRKMTAFKERQLSIWSRRDPKQDLEWSFVAYCSLMNTGSIFQQIRNLFKTAENKDMQFRDGQPAAAIALTLNACGLATGDLFISSLPWAMGRLHATPPSCSFDFSGFFGVDAEDFQRKLAKELMKICKEQLNILSEDSGAPEPAGPIKLNDVRVLTEYAFKSCGWVAKNTTPLRIKATLSSRSKNQNTDDIQLLNSFYVEDLQLISKALLDDKIGSAFAMFMSGGNPPRRIDIRQSTDVVQNGVMPCETPLSRWPSPYGLVYAQQFAINVIMKKLSGTNGIFSVNGPPGTGKTTLLRDIVANVVVDRAISMASYEKPELAFQRKINIEGWGYGITYRLDDKLCGNGIVVASANNGAVENITKELPNMEAIPKDCDLRYLADLSDSIFADNKAEKRKIGATWGLIAAALGNKANRTSFFGRFRGPSKKTENAVAPDGFVSFWDLMETSKEAVSWPDAKAAFLVALDRSTKERERMTLISESVLAVRSNEALLPEVEGRRNAAFQKVEEQKKLLNRLTVERRDAKEKTLKRGEKYRATKELCQTGKKLTAEQNLLKTQLTVLVALQKKADQARPQKTVAELRVELELAIQSSQITLGLLNSCKESKPGWIKRLFDWKVGPLWTQQLKGFQADLAGKDGLIKEINEEISCNEPIFSKIHESEMKVRGCQEGLLRTELGLSQIPPSYQQDFDSAEKDKTAAERDYHQISNKLSAVQCDLDHVKTTLDSLDGECRRIGSLLQRDREILKKAAVDSTTVGKWLNEGMSEGEIQLSEPWCDKAFSDARQELFCTAIKLHEAFIIHGFPKMKNSLIALSAMNGGAINPQAVTGGADQLWEILFLIVPVLSTSFASFSRMFQNCGCESLGWLLIDEAGQSTPQQACGAIWRSKRVVVVGDPLQLEPIVPLPPEVLETFQRRCEARGDYGLINSSAQVLADRANPLGTSIDLGPATGGKRGSAPADSQKVKWIGCPLRVHRRCLNPMFDISNAIAYRGMMVHGISEEQRQEERTGWAGRSCWIDMPATESVGHCVLPQVTFAVRLAHAITTVYNLKSGGKFNVYIITPFNDVNKNLDMPLFELYHAAKKGMHGTVHTFQGKEADVVIMVLGGQPNNSGVITSFAAAKANLLNVAVTRAKKRLYVVGDFDHWSRFDYFSEMSSLPRKSESEMNEIIHDLLGRDRTY